MKILEVRTDCTGVADLNGARHDVNLALVPDATPGIYVIVHAGYAIERINEHEAEEILKLFAEIAERQARAEPAVPAPHHA